MAATVLLEEHLARQKQENSRTSAWQVEQASAWRAEQAARMEAEQAAIMEEEKARIKEEGQKLVYLELTRRYWMTKPKKIKKNWKRRLEMKLGKHP